MCSLTCPIILSHILTRTRTRSLNYPFDVPPPGLFIDPIFVPLQLEESQKAAEESQREVRGFRPRLSSPR